MIEIVQKTAAFLVTLAVLIVFHEWGHYLVARLAGIKVIRFSVGFGRVVWSRRLGRDGTEWALSAIPLGGYVKMLDERESPVPDADKHRAFNRKGVWTRMAVVAAGPFANLLLAVALFTAMFVAGIDGLRAVLAEPPAASAAARAGFAAGDEVTSVGGRRVQSWQDLRWRLLRESGADSVDVGVRMADGRLGTRSLPLSGLTAADWEGEFPSKLGLALQLPPLPAAIGRVVPGSAAERAGLQPMDRVESVNGSPVDRWDALAAQIAGSPERPLELVVVRGSGREIVRVTPEAYERDGRVVGRIGVAPHVDPGAYASLRTVTRYGAGEALGHAVTRTWELSAFTLKMLWRIVAGDASLKNISGPLTMADYAGQSAQQGLATFLGYLALISISLGVLNLLPVPLLDGGHLMYYAVEVFKGRPVSERALDIGQQIGMAVLFALMALALYNDIARLF